MIFFDNCLKFFFFLLILLLHRLHLSSKYIIFFFFFSFFPSVKFTVFLLINLYWKSQIPHFSFLRNFISLLFFPVSFCVAAFFSRTFYTPTQLAMSVSLRIFVVERKMPVWPFRNCWSLLLFFHFLLYANDKWLPFGYYTILFGSWGSCIFSLGCLWRCSLETFHFISFRVTEVDARTQAEAKISNADFQGKLFSAVFLKHSRKTVSFLFTIYTFDRRHD